MATRTTPIAEAIRIDHGKIRDLIRRIRANPRDVPTAYPQLSALLKAHGSSEQQTLYRTLEQDPLMRSQIRRSYAEHQALDESVRRLDATKQGHPLWWTRFGATTRALFNHIGVEEATVLPASQTLPTPLQIALGQQYNALMLSMRRPGRTRMGSSTPLFDLRRRRMNPNGSMWEKFLDMLIPVR